MATASLVVITYFFINLTVNPKVLFFVFFGTLISYNIIKYSGFVLNFVKLKITLKLIFVLTFFSFFIEIFLFFRLNFLTQLCAVFFGFLSFLYLVPFKKNNKNLRNLAGVKVYIVSFCWAGVTLLLPLLDAELPIQNDVFCKFLQRFILTLILILIFEIKDLKYDDFSLKTVPQLIGVLRTKKVIFLLLLIFYILEFFKNNTYTNQWFVNLILIIITSLFVCFVNENRSKYFTSFWVESIPILWLLLILIFE